MKMWEYSMQSEFDFMKKIHTELKAPDIKADRVMAGFWICFCFSSFLQRTRIYTHPWQRNQGGERLVLTGCGVSPCF